MTFLRQFLSALAALGCLAYPLALPSLQAAEPPNFVVILVDDLGWTDLSCYGSKYYETPHIDRLASSGVRFTNGYAACAVCSPTRAALLTGRYPARLGITDWIRARFQGGRIPDDGKNPVGLVGGKRLLMTPANSLWMELDEITLAEALKPAGYVCCHIGKWHLGADSWYPDKQGFDVNIGGCDYGQPPRYFFPYTTRGQGPMPGLEAGTDGEYLTDREGSEATKFIEQNQDKPFFLYLAHYAVHTPIQGKEELKSKYEAKPKEGQLNATYAAMIESVDDSVGRVLEKLEELKLSERTVVIFTSDNGGLSGITNNAPLRAGKGTQYEGGIRVPYIFRWPGVVEPGSKRDLPISSVDIFPTVLEIANTAIPERSIDGESLVGVLQGDQSLERDAIFWHFPHYRGGKVTPYGIVRGGDYKLIRYYEDGQHELFNLAEDPSETKNLSGDMPDKVKQLDLMLSKWLTGVGARMPMRSPSRETSAEADR